MAARRLAYAAKTLTLSNEEAVEPMIERPHDVLMNFRWVIGPT